MIETLGRLLEGAPTERLADEHMDSP